MTQRKLSIDNPKESLLLKGNESRLVTQPYLTKDFLTSERVRNPIYFLSYPICRQYVMGRSNELFLINYLAQFLHFTEHLQAYHLVDAKWWSDQAVILARGTGSVTLSSTQTLKNLLGTSPEWFEPAPLITSAKDESFLGLEV